MKVLLASNYFHPEHEGGIETVAHNLARAYRGAGHHVRWLAADCGTAPHRGHPDDVPLPAVNVTETRLGVPFPVPLPWGVPQIVRAAAWCEVMHLHDCLYAANVMLFALAALLGRPVLLTQHIGMVPYRSQLLRRSLGLAYRTMGRWMLSRAGQVTFVSPAVRDWFATFVPFRSTPRDCANGVDSHLFRPASPEERIEIRRRLGVPADRHLLLFVGRFVEKKGLHLLRPLVERRADWSWLFVGRGRGPGPAAWDLPNMRVLPTLSQRELRNVYAAADLLVLPSVGEGLPMVVLEALACGTPVLTTADTAAAAGDGAALLVSAMPTAEAIESAAVGALAMATADHRRHISEQAARLWGWEALTAEYLTLLDRLVAAGRTGDEVRRLA